MDVIGDRTRHVFCRSIESGGSGDPSIHTALGVFYGIRASLAHAFGSDDPAGRTVLVQGAGSVGAKLAKLLAEAGATVLVSDVDEERARATGAATVPPAAALETECDVYAPCALGATLNADSIPRLRCPVVAGAANNQLETDEDGERLRARGVLYAPDYVINGGGALHGIGLEHLGWDASGSSARSQRSARRCPESMPTRTRRESRPTPPQRGSLPNVCGNLARATVVAREKTFLVLDSTLAALVAAVTDGEPAAERPRRRLRVCRDSLPAVATRSSHGRAPENSPPRLTSAPPSRAATPNRAAVPSVTPPPPPPRTTAAGITVRPSGSSARRRHGDSERVARAVENSSMTGMLYPLFGRPRAYEALSSATASTRERSTNDAAVER